MTQFVIMPAIVMGTILGIIELYFVHQDESGLGWLSHGLHAIPTMIIFIFIAMNLKWALAFVNMHENFWADLGARVIIGFIAMAKIAGAASITGKVGERKIHILIIGVLVMASPYLWDYFVKDLVKQYAPWLNS